MVTYEDLAPCDIFGSQLADGLRAIGWLGAGTIVQGDTTKDCFDKLRSLMQERTQMVVAAGVHECEQCQFDGAVGNGELFVPAKNTLFVCPELIVHYIATHRYRPPDAFLDAVMECPLPNTMDYKKRFLAAGGGRILKALR